MRLLFFQWHSRREKKDKLCTFCVDCSVKSLEWQMDDDDDDDTCAQRKKKHSNRISDRFFSHRNFISFLYVFCIYKFSESYQIYHITLPLCHAFFSVINEWTRWFSSTAIDIPWFRYSIIYFCFSGQWIEFVCLQVPTQYDFATFMVCSVEFYEQLNMRPNFLFSFSFSFGVWTVKRKKYD